MKELVEKGYDKIAVEYNFNRLTKGKVVSEYFDSLSHFFPQSGKILDLGCGGGEPVTAYFARKGFQVTGVDISERMIEIARKQIPQGNFIRGDMTECLFDEATFDLIVSIFAIIHIPQPEQEQLLRNIWKWLRSSGIAYLTLGAINEQTVIRDWKGVSMYWSHFGPEEYRLMLHNIGFELLSDEIEVLPNGERFYNVIMRKSKVSS
jgi:2-polyprenyl-3-methyl-5-hydroxy-6-metoxy-1,4-benzoquinol methylase